MQLVWKKFVVRTRHILFAVYVGGDGSGSSIDRDVENYDNLSATITCTIGVECDGLWRIQWTFKNELKKN